jgi:hypothetical protein
MGKHKKIGNRCDHAYVWGSHLAQTRLPDEKIVPDGLRIPTPLPIDDHPTGWDHGGGGLGGTVGARSVRRGDKDGEG